MTVLVHSNAPPIGACQGPYGPHPAVLHGHLSQQIYFSPEMQGQLETLSSDEVEG